MKNKIEMNDKNNRLRCIQKKFINKIKNKVEPFPKK